MIFNDREARVFSFDHKPSDQEVFACSYSPPPIRYSITEDEKGVTRIGPADKEFGTGMMCFLGLVFNIVICMFLFLFYHFGVIDTQILIMIVAAASVFFWIVFVCLINAVNRRCRRLPLSIWIDEDQGIVEIQGLKEAVRFDSICSLFERRVKFVNSEGGGMSRNVVLLVKGEDSIYELIFLGINVKNWRIRSFIKKFVEKHRIEYQVIWKKES